MIWEPLTPSGAQNGAQDRPMLPKGDPKGCGLVTFWVSQNRLASKIAFGALLGTILVDFGTPWHQNHGISHDCSIHVDEILSLNSGHRFASSGVKCTEF